MRTLAILVGSLVGLAVVLLAYSFVEPYWIKVRVMPVRDADIPPAFEGTTIAFVSDIHHGPFFSRRRVTRIVDKINYFQPDIVLLGGDYVHRDPRYIVPCFEELQHLTAPLGIFGVLGNHDHWEDAGLTRQRMQQAGITNLDNQAVWIVRGDERIKIGGVGDLWEDAQDLTPTLAEADDDDFVMLVSHNPDYAESLTTTKIDLMVSGHTHGGQVTLFGLWAPLVPSQYGQKYRSGSVQTAVTRVLVSHGVGTITPPVRFFARPDILLIILHRT